MNAVLDLVHLLEIVEGVEDILVLVAWFDEDLGRIGPTLGMKVWRRCSSASRALPRATISMRVFLQTLSEFVNYSDMI